MIKGLFFCCSLFGSLLRCALFFLGPMVGLNRKNIRRELREFAAKKNHKFILEKARMEIFYFAEIGFLLSVSRPIFGLIGAMFFFDLQLILRGLLVKLSP